MTEIEPEGVIARWFDAMLMRHRLNTERAIDANEIQRPSDGEVEDSVNSILQMLIELHEPGTRDIFAESLIPPSATARTEQTHLAPHQQLAEALNHLSADANAFGAAMAALVPVAADHTLLRAEPLPGSVIPYGQVDEAGNADLSIYNASYIPARYWPPYVRTSGGAEQSQTDEAEVITYLTEKGLDKDLLTQAAAAFKSASERLRFFERLGALVSVMTYVLATLRRELADPALSADDMQVSGFTTKKRRTIQI
ncbi:hypothetical protein [Cognatiyoonia sp. IB215182]|uniref:hypothetical protein n=1 Tax=Cognatiyoonia sp. IB215182 TaxID=3097353 RepID=UPI002A0BD03E|nr:hypothetical protein [Cognatiyoonia sp. IB215182]MDX8355147.1 hypothetical protein [Cognatiyoonia sp. IB215182]